MHQESPVVAVAAAVMFLLSLTCLCPSPPFLPSRLHFTSQKRFSDEQRRAAKARFILLWLPHLRGTTEAQFVDLYREFHNYYLRKGHNTGIGRLIDSTTQ